MSLYRQTFPPIIKYLNNFSSLLTKAATFADDKGMKHEEMLNFTLAPNLKGQAFMHYHPNVSPYSLPYQVQTCSNIAKNLATRIGSIEDVYFEDNEATFEQLQARITKTIDLLRSVDAEKMAGKDSEPVLMGSKNATFKFESGQDYVSDYALPYFYFHLSSAYCILKHLSVEIDAFDYLGKDTFVKA